jgi:phage tail sheath protein FI
MPTTPTYPGVYIEEIPSGVRTIIGVATSIAAFIGRTLRGPTNQAITINSYADFERFFGGLWVSSTLSYAVRDFYLNGGNQAVIVRLQRGATKAKLTAPSSTATNTIALEAISEGSWGNELRARIDHDVSAEVAASFGLTANDLFNLTVVDMKTGVTEQLRNLTVTASPRQVDRVLLNESNLVRVVALPLARPDANDANLIVTAADPNPAVSDPAKAELRKPPFASNIRSVGVASTDRGDDGTNLVTDDFIGTGKDDAKQGLYALKQVDLFNILCIPPYLSSGNIDYVNLIPKLVEFCEQRRAMLLIDSPDEWKNKDAPKNNLSAIGTNSKNASLFFPRLRQPNPLRGNQVEDFAPCGAVAGVFARTDAQRGVWKAPAGLDASLNGVSDFSVNLTDAENGELNPLGVNCLRTFPAVGQVVWGSRTLQGDDRLASEWKYIPIRRLTLFLEESLYRGTKWVVFEPNDEPLWAQIRLNLNTFMLGLFRQGAFQGSTPDKAFYVRCDGTTTTQADRDRGIVNIEVGFAPLKPAEFVIIKIQQIAGDL